MKRVGLASRPVAIKLISSMFPQKSLAKSPPGSNGSPSFKEISHAIHTTQTHHPQRTHPDGPRRLQSRKGQACNLHKIPGHIGCDGRLFQQAFSGMDRSPARNRPPLFRPENPDRYRRHACRLGAGGPQARPLPFTWRIPHSRKLLFPNPPLPVRQLAGHLRRLPQIRPRQIRMGRYSAAHQEA